MARSAMVQYFRSLRGAAEDARRQRLLSLLVRTGPEVRVLDLGCGDGQHTLQVSEVIGVSHDLGHIIGVDCVRESLCHARSQGIEVLQVDLDEPLPFKDETFDVLIATEVIEHLRDTDRFLKEVYRILRPAGYLYLTTPNLAALHNILLLVAGRQPLDADVSDERIGLGSIRWAAQERPREFGPAHRRIFTARALKDLLEYHSFAVESSATAGFLPCPKLTWFLWLAILAKFATFLIVRARKGLP